MSIDDEPQEPGSTLNFLTGGGEMGERIRAYDWSTTQLGPIASWSQNLRSALSICLNSNFPIAIYWGDELRLLYNDDWSPIPGDKHPWVLGQPARTAWPEIWHIIEPLFQNVLVKGEATRRRDQLLPMHRHGYTEECYFDYTFSPIRGEDGQVKGVFNAGIETTQRVIGERRLRTLRELAGWKTGEARSAEEACGSAVQVVAENPYDLPFVLLYLLDRSGRTVKLINSSGLTPDVVARLPQTLPIESTTSPWPFLQTIAAGNSVEVAELPEVFESLTGGIWPEPSRRAIVLPMAKSGQTQLAGFVVAGLSPRLAFNDDYRGFLELLASHIAAAVTNARAYADERARSDALAELDRAKTAFFSNISHEFRTPLTLILGPLEVLLGENRASLSDPVISHLELVNRNSLRLLRLVNNLLDFSRIEAGRLVARFQPTDLAELTADLTSSFRSACERAGLQLHVDCPPLDELVYVDREMWEKIVLNLLSNAFKFTFQGSITIKLQSGPEQVQLQVLDTGIGIPAGELPRLFERFHRVQQVRARTHEGSGIGLAMVHELIQLHGGQVDVVSEVDLGTTFTIRLPKGSAHLPVAQLGTQQANESPGDSRAPSPSAASYLEEALRWLPTETSNGDTHQRLPTLRTKATPSTSDMASVNSSVVRQDNRPRILIADDNADMRQYISRILSEHFAIETVEDGNAALRAVSHLQPDLILSDVMMPGPDGFQLLRKLRASPLTAQIPIILLSARAGEESRVEGLEAGADDYLVKPFGARELLARVSASLKLARLRRDAAGQIAELNDVLRRKIEEFEALMHVLPVGVFVARDPECRDISMNPAGAAMLRLPVTVNPSKTGPEAEVLPFRLYQNGREMAADDLPMQRAVRTGIPVNAEEVDIRFPDGTAATLFEYAMPMFDSSGVVRGCVGVFVDITDRKRSEAILLEADHRKDEFLATLAHELRNPLAPLRNGLQVMKLESHNASAVERSRDMMERQLGHMVRLIDDLLDVSRIRLGKITLQKQRVQLANVIQQAVEISRPLINDHGHQLSIQGLSDAIILDADATRLAQVFSNLLNNAAKYTERGGLIQVEISTSDNTVSVRVRDNGVGISATMLPKLFEMFTQVDRSLERSRGGLGIGLSLVKQLIEMHGGHVSARSEGPGTGSEFTVRLPLNLKEVRTPTESTAPIPSRSAPRHRILVVDDNRDAALSLAMMLKIMGHETETAHDGIEALEAAPSFHPDLILLDIGMPRLNGYDTARRIRQVEWGKNLMLVALTGWGQDQDRRMSQEAGFDFHLVKPVELSELEKILATTGAR